MSQLYGNTIIGKHDRLRSITYLCSLCNRYAHANRRVQNDELDRVKLDWRRHVRRQSGDDGILRATEVAGARRLL